MSRPAAPARSSTMLETRVFDVPMRPRRLSSTGARVTLVLGCHGGAGATTVATSLGTMLARTGARVCVLDLDLQFGGVLTALNLTNRHPLNQLVADPRRLDGATLLPRLPRHAGGLFALSQVGNVDGAGQVEPARLPAVLRGLRACFDQLIIDGVRDFTDHALPAMDLADDVVLVATQDVPALRGLVMRLDLFRRLRFERAAFHVLLNRYSRRGAVSLPAIESALGVRPSFTVRNDFRSVHRALDEGRPLIEVAPRSVATRDLWKVAGELFGVAPARRRTLWKRRAR